ncbi:5'(3')-deoxyribonucleotidase [Mucilaginibacter sp. PAMC 26640]|nr:5'(3')-deoxyribonucleotidase [Mucilaginibacter sp. PAMC 26640]
MKKSIAIDMDGVLADVEQQFLNWYQRDYDVLFNKEYLIGKDEANLFPEPGAARTFATSAGFFLDIPVMDGAIEAVKKLMESYEIYIVSAAMEFPVSLIEKHEWLKVNFPFIHWRNIIFCGDKSIINTDYMIDDHLKNLDNFKGKTIMFNAFHNINYHHHVRANNWDDVLKLLST